MEKEYYILDKYTIDVRDMNKKMNEILRNQTSIKRWFIIGGCVLLISALKNAKKITKDIKEFLKKCDAKGD